MPEHWLYNIETWKSHIRLLACSARETRMEVDEEDVEGRRNSVVGSRIRHLLPDFARLRVHVL